MLLLSNMTLATQYDDDEIGTGIDQSVAEVEEMQELPKASSKLIAELRSECENYALDDYIPDDMLKEYMTSCVDDELDAQGYQKIHQVAKADPNQ